MTEIANGDLLAWTPALLQRLRELRLAGETISGIADILNIEYPELSFNYSRINNAISRHNLGRFMERDAGVRLYGEMTLPEENYIVSCDYHAPFFSELWVNRLLAIAQKFGIKKHIIAGDLFDSNFAKWQKVMDGEETTSLDDEAAMVAPLMKALDYFDDIFLISGNHETRVGRITEAKVQFKHIVKYLGGAIAEKLKYSEFDKVNIGEKWLVVHPRSYSQISASVAIRLAEKYHRNVLNAHGHFIAMRFDRSGKYMGIDLGGMFDPLKIGYASLSTTTHPKWENGFLMLLNNHAYLFHQETDFCYWLE